MCEVAARASRRGASPPPEHPVDRDQVDELIAGADLPQVELALVAIHRAAQHAAIEGGHRLEVVATDHEKTEASQGEGSGGGHGGPRSEEHTSELQSIIRISYAVFCMKKKQKC